MDEQAPLLLLIETSTKNCSVALSSGGQVLTSKEHITDGYSHAEQLHVSIQDLLKEAKRSTQNLSAIAVSIGPGSYTGLRIGLSAAKGLCFALAIPLITFNALEAMAIAFQKDSNGLLIGKKNPIREEFQVLSMLDARRMEVYMAWFNSEAKPETEIEPFIFDEASAKSILEGKENIVLVGDAQDKLKVLLGDTVSYSSIVYPRAMDVAELVHDKYQSNQFANLAYIEPNYLKEFQAGKPKNLLR